MVERKRESDSSKSAELQAKNEKVRSEKVDGDLLRGVGRTYDKETQTKRAMTWEEFEIATDILAKRIFASERRFKSVSGIPRGGLIVAVVLSHKLGVKYEPLSNAKPDTLICDDVSDSGKTLMNCMNEVGGHFTATIFVKEQSDFQPSFSYKTVRKDEYVVFPWERDE